jgi:hypothetical protein
MSHPLSGWLTLSQAFAGTPGRVRSRQVGSLGQKFWQKFRLPCARRGPPCCLWRLPDSSKRATMSVMWLLGRASAVAALAALVSCAAFTGAARVFGGQQSRYEWHRVRSSLATVSEHPHRRRAMPSVSTTSGQMRPADVAPGTVPPTILSRAGADGASPGSSSSGLSCLLRPGTASEALRRRRPRRRVGRFHPTRQPCCTNL